MADMGWDGMGQTAEPHTGGQMGGQLTFGSLWLRHGYRGLIPLVCKDSVYPDFNDEFETLI